MAIKDKVRFELGTLFARFDEKEKSLKLLYGEIGEYLEVLRREIVQDKQRVEKERNERIKEKEKLEKLAVYLDERIEVLEDVLRDLNYGKPDDVIRAYEFIYIQLDKKLSKYFENKTPHPAPMAAKMISSYAKEIKFLNSRLCEYEYLIGNTLEETMDVIPEPYEMAGDDEDVASYFLSKEDYDRLPIEDKYQKALDAWLNKSHSKSEIGKIYERQIGYMYESKGYKVEYRGIEKGVHDGGIDLICSNMDEVLIVQCKCWSQVKTFHENYICQLLLNFFGYGKICGLKTL